MNMEMISVIVPTYNRAAYLPLAVNSALGQIGTEVEVIVVDDGSTDDTECAVQTHASHWGEKVRIIRQENAERSVARNNGLRIARGEFVAFLDSDDLWQPDHALACVTTLHEHPEAVAAYGEYGLIASDGNVIRDCVARPAHEGTLFLRELCLKRLILHPSEVVLRRSALDSSDVFNPEIPGGEDWLAWIELSRHGPFRRVGKRTVWMRVHPKGTFGEPYKFAHHIMLAAQKVIATGVPKDVRISGDRILAINRTHCAYAHYLSGHWTEAWRYLMAALRQYPAVLCEPDYWKVTARLCVGKKLSQKIRMARQRAKPAEVGVDFRA